MKSHRLPAPRRIVSLAFASLLPLLTPHATEAQGSLHPPDDPAPTMKSLQEIYERVGLLESQVQDLQTENTTLANHLLSVAENLGLRWDWVITTFHADGGAVNVGDSSSMVIAPSGWPAIAYHHETDGKLRLATYYGSYWSHSTVDSGAGDDVGNNPSLAYDPDNDYPAISHYNETHDNLEYTYRNETGWHYTTVADAGDVGYRSSLAFRSNGMPAIAFHDRTNRRLRLAWWRPDLIGGWQFKTVHNLGWAGQGCSLAIHPTNGRPFITYTSYNISGGGSLWIAEIPFKFYDLYDPIITEIDEVGGYVYWTSLAFTPQNRPAVAYYVSSEAILKYAEFDGTDWQTSVVDDTGLTGLHCSLSFSPDGHPAISYHDQTNTNLRYAVHDGTAWRITTVDSDGNTGTATSLVFMPNGMPAISYRDHSTTSLNFAELRSSRLLP